MVAVPTSPAGYSMAPSAEEWAALSPAQRAVVVAALVTYDEMAWPEGDRHAGAKVRALDALRGYFARLRGRIYVTSDLPTYYPAEPRFAPDLLVVLDAEDVERDKWIVSAEGQGLDWVLEIHVGGDRKQYAERNIARYARLGIPEYFLYDRARNWLHAYRLASPDARVYTAIATNRGLYESRVLGLDVAVEKDRLRFYTGTALLLETEEIIARIQARADAALRRAEEEVQLRAEAARCHEEAVRRREEASRSARRRRGAARRRRGVARRRCKRSRGCAPNSSGSSGEPSRRTHARRSVLMCYRVRNDGKLKRMLRVPVELHRHVIDREHDPLPSGMAKASVSSSSTRLRSARLKVMVPTEMLAEMLRLPEEERARLALELIRSLDGEPEVGADEEWDAEIDRRGAEVDAGTAETVTLAEYRAHVQRRRAARAGR